MSSLITLLANRSFFELRLIVTAKVTAGGEAGGAVAASRDLHALQSFRESDF